MISRFVLNAALLSLGVLLSACAASPERTAERNRDRCIAAGHREGTDAFAGCLAQIETNSDVRREANRRFMMESRPDTPLSGR